MKCDGYTVCCCSTLNDEYIITGGGKDGDGNYMDKLYVWDNREDEEYKLMECDIKLPINNVKHKMVRSGAGIKDAMLVVVWIKKQCKNNDLKYLAMTSVYWFTGAKKVEHLHCCSKIKHILCCLVESVFYDAFNLC